MGAAGRQMDVERGGGGGAAAEEMGTRRRERGALEFAVYGVQDARIGESSGDLRSDNWLLLFELYGAT